MILLPTTIGLEDPAPGSSVFQAMLSFADQVVGRFFSVEMPSPPGPRNCSQSADAGMATTPKIRAADIDRSVAFMEISSEREDGRPVQADYAGRTHLASAPALSPSFEVVHAEPRRGDSQ